MAITALATVGNVPYIPACRQRRRQAQPCPANGRCQRVALGWPARAVNYTDVRAQEAVNHPAPWLCRRALLGAPLALMLSNPGQAMASEEYKHFSSGGIAFDYPSKWLLAYDRAEKVASGSLVLVGDFSEVDTVSVQRTELVEELNGLADGALSAQQASEMLLSEPLSSSSTLGLQILDASSYTPSPAPSPVYRVEYVLNVCRGLVEEGAGGGLRCVTANGTELETVERHHINLYLVKQGMLYTFSASAVESRWRAIGNKLLAVAESFTVTA